MKESLRRLTLVLIYIVGILFLLNWSVKGRALGLVWDLIKYQNIDTIFPIAVIFLSVLALHKACNWVFQKDDRGGFGFWDSYDFSEIFKVNWVFISAGICLSVLLGGYSSALEQDLMNYDFAKVLGNYTGRIIGAGFLGYLVGVVVNFAMEYWYWK